MRRVTTAPCAPVLAQQHEPTSTENQTMAASERTEGSTATRITPSEGSDFKAGPAHAKSESSPASVAMYAPMFTQRCHQRADPGSQRKECAHIAFQQRRQRTICRQHQVQTCQRVIHKRADPRIAQTYLQHLKSLTAFASPAVTRAAAAFQQHRRQHA